MISTEFRQKFKAQFGENYRYTGKIKGLLEAAEIFNQKGNTYSSGSIRNVFNGIAEDKDIELKIYQLYDMTIDRRKKLKKLEDKHNPKLEESN